MIAFIRRVSALGCSSFHFNTYRQQRIRDSKSGVESIAHSFNRFWFPVRLLCTTSLALQRAADRSC